MGRYAGRGRTKLVEKPYQSSYFTESFYIFKGSSVRAKFGGLGKFDRTVLTSIALPIGSYVTQCVLWVSYRSPPFVETRTEVRARLCPVWRVRNPP
jgi:hypothetical protein